MDWYVYSTFLVQERTQSVFFLEASFTQYHTHTHRAFFYIQALYLTFTHTFALGAIQASVSYLRLCQSADWRSRETNY